MLIHSNVQQKYPMSRVTDETTRTEGDTGASIGLEELLG